MCAVFKFASTVEEFSIALDCDKSELSVVLACKDGINLCVRACLLLRGTSAPVCFRCPLSTACYAPTDSVLQANHCRASSILCAKCPASCASSRHNQKIPGAV